MEPSLGPTLTTKVISIITPSSLSLSLAVVPTFPPPPSPPHHTQLFPTLRTCQHFSHPTPSTQPKINTKNHISRHSTFDSLFSLNTPFLSAPSLSLSPHFASPPWLETISTSPFPASSAAPYPSTS